MADASKAESQSGPQEIERFLKRERLPRRPTKRKGRTSVVFLCGRQRLHKNAAEHPGRKTVGFLGAPAPTSAGQLNRVVPLLSGTMAAAVLLVGMTLTLTKTILVADAIHKRQRQRIQPSHTPSGICQQQQRQGPANAVNASKVR